MLADITARDKDGELARRSRRMGRRTTGRCPKILIMPSRQRPGAPTPGVGDRALIRTEVLRDARPGRAQPIAAASSSFCSVPERRCSASIRADPRGGGRVLPIDKKNVGRGELFVPQGSEGEAQDGDLVAVDVMRDGRLGLPAAKVRERLGSLATEKAMSLIALHAHGIPNVFRPETLAEAERARPAAVAEREDWRPFRSSPSIRPTPRIMTTRSSPRPIPIPNNPGGHVISCRDRRCRRLCAARHAARPRRARSRQFGLFPRSRRAHAAGADFERSLFAAPGRGPAGARRSGSSIAAEGKRLAHRVPSHHDALGGEALLCAGAGGMDGMPGAETQSLLDDVLRPLFAAYESLKTARTKRAPLDLDLPERKILLKPDGTVDRVIVPPRLEAHRLIEEFMILANVAAAEALEDKRQSLIYRAHDEPSIEKLNATLANFSPRSTSSWPRARC